MSTSTSSSVNVSEDSAENMTESECFLTNFNSSSNLEISSSQIYEKPKRRRKYRRIHEKKKQMDYEKLMEVYKYDLCIIVTNYGNRTLYTKNEKIVHKSAST